jgi:UDP-N-acetyl-D-galactosamine dehydrogenase
VYEQLLQKKAKLAVIGLGYVGLPIALEFARKLSVIGFDINAARVDLMRNGIDPSGELEAKDFEGCDITFTDSLEVLREATFYIVAVPTPIDEHAMPDLKPLLGASTSVGKVLKKGDYVVFESTVYPGCTEEDCIPVMEKLSGLSFPQDFKVGYSPERINPGDKEHTLTSIIKVVAGCDDESLDIIAKLYELVVKAGVHRASSIKVAEAAKIIENTQRDVNIALMNELSLIFDRMNINTYEVLEAAGTKWNFLKFSPGLVGGHCIGVDPYYLTYKAKELGFDAKVILSGRSTNDNMGAYIARKTKVADVIQELKNFSVNVDIVDPHADSDELHHEYGFRLTSAEETRTDYDAVIVAVSHKPYIEKDEAYFQGITSDNAVLVDIKGLYRGKMQNMHYWSL